MGCVASPWRTDAHDMAGRWANGSLPRLHFGADLCNNPRTLDGTSEKGAIGMEFRVRWEIDVDASSAEDAARQAFTMMQAPTTARVFDVSEWVDDEAREGDWLRVDLDALDDHADMVRHNVPTDERGE